MTRVRDVSIDAPGGPLPAFFARSFDFPNPTVVVLQEWWGLNGHIQDVTLRFTNSHEWSAIAPDLYRGQQTEEPDEARKLRMGLDEEQVSGDLGALVGWLTRQGVDRIAVVGFCMGGGLAMNLAHADERLAAAAVFYGGFDLDGPGPRCPVIGHYGSKDRWSAEELEGLEAHLRPAGGEVHVYPGAGHAFFNPTGDTFDPEAADLAWDRTLAFFGRHLHAD